MTQTEESPEQVIKFVLEATILSTQSLDIIASTLNPPLDDQEINIIRKYLLIVVTSKLLKYPEKHKYIKAYASFLRNEVSRSDDVTKGEHLFKTTLEYETNSIFSIS